MENIQFFYYFKNACKEFDNENYQDAINFFNLAIGIYPGSAESYLRRGFALLNSGSRRKDGSRPPFESNYYEDAKEDFKKSLELFNLDLKIDKNNPKLYLLRGIAKIKCADDQGALEDFSLSIQKGLNNNSALFNRALTYASISKFNSAIRDFSRVIEIDPTDTSAYLRRSSCKHYLEDFDGALKDLRKVENISLDSDQELSQKCIDFLYRFN